MITATRPLAHRLRGIRAHAGGRTLTLLLTYAVASQGDPEFENTVRHEVADVDGVRTRDRLGCAARRTARTPSGVQMSSVE